MSHTKTEIPAAMLVAATAAVADHACHVKWNDAEEARMFRNQAQAALEAAGVPALLSELDRIHDNLAKRQHSDSAAWERVIAAMGEDGNEDGVGADRACRLIERQRERIAELEAAALAYLKAEEIYNAAHLKNVAGLGICQKAAKAEETLAEVLGHKLKSAESAGGE